MDVIMNIAVVIYSWHLSRWRRSGLPLFVKGIREIIRDLASPTEEVSIRLFYSSLQITFPNNVRVMRMTGHPTEERGGVSRAH